MTLLISNRRAKPRWAILIAVVAALVLALATSSLAVHGAGEFELDKDAADNTETTPAGYLASNINAGAPTLNVCQVLSYTYNAGQPDEVTLTYDAPVAGDTLLIRSERMTLDQNNAGNFGGNCPGQKRSYVVTRPDAVAQSGGGNNIGALISVIREDDPADDPTPGPDWDTVFNEWTADNNTKCEDIGLVECVYVHDGIGPTTYTQGSTKDHLPLSGWRHTSGASPDKGEILNAYAAKAIAPVGGVDHQVIYFGMDRYAVDGSTDIGFWFFQDKVVACNDTSIEEECDGVPAGQFAGEHREGDVLVLGTFTQGGATSNIRVFQWTGDAETGTADGPTGAFGDCHAAATGDEGCATVNNTTIEAEWGDNYVFKGSSTGGWIPAGGFFEGGIDLTAAGLDGCFSTFLAETRSSPEITAILKDFALGDFEACETELTTTPYDAGDPLAEPPVDPAALSDSNDNGIPDVQIGLGGAGVDVTDSAMLDIKGTGTWSGDLEFFICGPLDAPILDDPDTEEVDESVPGDTCDEGGLSVGSQTVDQDTGQPVISADANLTEVGYYCWRGEFTPDQETEDVGVPGAEDASEGECFEVLPVDPTLTTQVVDESGAALAETSVPFGQDLYDQATLSGTANQRGTDGGDAMYPSIEANMDTEAGGTITFSLYGPLPDPPASDAPQEEKDAYAEACDTLAAGFATEYPDGIEVDIDNMGDGDYDTTGSGFAPSAPGLYAWKAVYDSSDANTNGTSHNDDCDEPTELVTVLQLQPTMDTAQSFVPNDSATISVEAGAGDLSGSVWFYLFVDDALCAAEEAGGAIDLEAGIKFGGEEGFAVFAEDDGSTDPLTATADSDNETAYTDNGDDPKTFHWVVVFESDNDAHLDVTSPCGNEHSSISVDDGVTQPVAPEPEE